MKNYFIFFISIVVTLSMDNDAVQQLTTVDDEYMRNMSNCRDKIRDPPGVILCGEWGAPKFRCTFISDKERRDYQICLETPIRKVFVNTGCGDSASVADYCPDH
ncbi:uncharacterized protein LOC117171921 isoform X2 [Belonocnema kinseyi]|uniref:uncharacterized protein LOC117171921 isoform X2 n=1 Tax=Belonocnema kinseyi TaxID=2817044 RepID=UPI00143DF506|nr:uncharacterized protein LOC117171921 isoform X2 [Belonocnema kinseyi]